MISVNTEKCIKCFKCIKVCPFNVLELNGEIPSLREDRKCLKCMHCVATCNENAITFCGKDIVDKCNTPILMKENADVLETTEMLLKSRRSYRSFKNEPIKREILEKALEIASYAPSAKNQHPTKFIVVNSKEAIDDIMNSIIAYVKETGTSPEIITLLEEGKNVVVGEATALVLAYSSENAINPWVDSALALHDMELWLQAKGIGTCWGGYLTRMCNGVPYLQEKFNLPENHKFYATLFMGYPKNENYIHIPGRKNKIEEYTTWM